MPDASTLYVYCLAVLALLIVPGPAVVYIVTRSIDQGRRAGLVSVAGIHIGSIVHVTAAAAGVSAIIARSATAFTALRLGGAAWLVTLGVLRLIRGGESASGDPQLDSDRRILWQGFWVNALNPKTALFFLAFLPQFVDPQRGNVVTQTMILGGAFIVLGLLSDSAYALLAGGAGSFLRRTGTVVRFQRRIAGCTYIALGLLSALFVRRSTAS